MPNKKLNWTDSMINMFSKWTIFKDDNDWNEKSIIGFISFIIMCLTAFIDIGLAIWGKPLVINEFIYNSFVIVTLGSFGVSGFEKWALNLRNKNSIKDNTEDQNETS